MGLVLPRDPHGPSTGLLWSFHGNPMVLPRDSHGPSMGLPWDIQTKTTVKVSTSFFLRLPLTRGAPYFIPKLEFEKNVVRSFRRTIPGARCATTGSESTRGFPNL